MAEPLSQQLSEVEMLWTLGVVLVGVWLLGLATEVTLGGFIHLLLVLALISVLVRVLRGNQSL
jgi:hypothetical protein